MSEEEKKYILLMMKYALMVPPSKIPKGIWTKIKGLLELLEEKGHLARRYEYNGLKNKGRYRFMNSNVDDYFENPIYYENLLISNEDFQKYVKYMKKWEAKPKYKLGNTHSYLIHGKEIIVHQIVAEKDFTAKNESFAYQLITKGTTAGWIEKESNLSQEGFCWNEKGVICENAKIIGDAFVYNCTICGNAIIQGNALCENSTIDDNVVISDDARIYYSTINDNVEVFGNCVILTCNLSENIWIENSRLDHETLKGNYKIKW